MLGIAAMGAIGACLRFYFGQRIRWNAAKDFPFATLVINVTGSALLGMLWSMYELNAIGELLWQLLGTGLLGAYTTFSTFSYELFSLLQKKRIIAASLYLLATVVLGIVAAASARVIVHMVALN